MDAQHSITLQAKQGSVLTKNKKQISLSQMKPSSQTSHQNLNSSQNPSYAALNPIQISKVEYRQESQDHKSSSLRTPKLPAQIRLKNNQTKAAKRALTNLKVSQQ